MWEYVIGGATIFGAFVAGAALVNGRFTRKHIDRLIEEMRKEYKGIHKNQEAMLKNQEIVLKNQEAMLKNQEIMAAALQKALAS